MEPLKTKTLYSRSGNQFARSLFCKQTEEVSPSLGPTIWIFEDFHELKSTKKVLETILSISCSEIRTQADILRYNDATRGHFLGTVSLFDAAFRLEYARKTLTHTIARLDVSGPRKHIEALIRLGYEHGESVSKTHRYHLSGSELTIRDIGQMIHISFFDDEVDEILVGEVRDTGEVAQFHRVDSVTFYAKESPEIGGIPKEVQKINGTGRLWTFDLDFFEKRDALREMYTDWIGFETGGTSLNVEPISLPDIESFTELLRTAGNQTSIYTAFREPVLRHMEYNSLSSHALIDVPKIGLTSFCYKNHFSITDDVLGTLFVQKRSKKQTMRSLDLLMTLKPGDYIVHQEHGIGRFLEMIEKDVGGTKREYVCIEYANSDRLFVPITELYRITKYL
jgi:transcription-repair coupling factor (superfamily II helicase)